SKPFLSYGIAEHGELIHQIKTANAIDLKAWVDFQTEENEETLGAHQGRPGSDAGAHRERCG
ncbi:MAG: hypothetical protein KJ822_01495, partial [Proteobacteria bacterium]|nr:hypothetical protein [Pseudomonadota bacterium]